MNRQFTITTFGSGSFSVDMTFTALPDNPHLLQVNLNINGALASFYISHHNGTPSISFDAIDIIRHTFCHFVLSPKEHSDCAETVAREILLTATPIFKQQLLNPQDLYDFLATLPNFGEGGRVGRRMLKNIPLDELITAVQQSPKVMALLKSQNRMELIA